MNPSRIKWFTLALTAVALATASLAHAVDQPTVAYQIICHPSTTTSTVERRFLVDTFLKKIRTWPNGETTRPVDLPASSSVRRQFTLDIMKRPVEAVREYWQQRIFAGTDLPPTELDHDEEVVRYVLKNRGAIGYVSAAAVLDGAKVLSVK